MASGTGVQKAARKLQQETGVAFQICFNILKKYKREAEQLKDEEPHKPFTECLLETGRKYIEPRM